MIDEIGVWSRALTALEITNLYNGGNGVYGDVTNTIYASAFITGWHLDELFAVSNTPSFGDTNYWISLSFTNMVPGKVQIP
jgi:hypothetical protein